MTDTWREVIMPQFTRGVRYGKVPKIQAAGIPKQAKDGKPDFAALRNSYMMLAVEAGGFEPPSRDASRQASTCLVA